MSSLLIIGGTGFFGKSILDLFIRGGLQNYGVKKIIIVARHIDKFKLNYPGLINDYVQLISLDISTCNSLPDADLVIHAAASSNARDYIIDSNSQKSNIEVSTINYCELAEKYHRNAKIVYCSSGAVYGQQPKNVDSMAEDFPFQDVSGLVDYKRDYAIGKRISENAIRNLGLVGLDVSIARCFAFYGKYLPRDQHFALGNFIGAAEQGNNIEVHSKHRVIRSYMHADEMVHSLIQIALEANPKCPIFNVGSGDPIEIRDLANKIANEYGVGVKINKIDNDNVDRYIPNISRLDKLNLQNNKKFNI